MIWPQWQRNKTFGAFGLVAGYINAATMHFKNIVHDGQS
jgi:hypothetical protein